MRQYEPIWHKLKSLPKEQAENVGVTISAPTGLHRRIIKAVKKEKYKDFVYKLNAQRSATLYHECKGGMITFKLKFSFCIKDF